LPPGMPVGLVNIPDKCLVHLRCHYGGFSLRIIWAI
jgi:hypothetical protein